MKINKRLNLVIPVETETGLVYVHSMPISEECFYAHFLLLSKTWAALIDEGLLQLGPRVAILMLRKVATAMLPPREPGQPAPVSPDVPLLAEIRRLSNAILPGERGYSTVPFQDVIDKQLLDSAELNEIEGQIVFFICASSVPKATTGAKLAEMAAKYWDSLLTQLNVTEYKNSLQTLTVAENTGETPNASSVPC